MATSKRLPLGLTALALAAAGCGQQAKPPASGSTASSGPKGSQHQPTAAATARSGFAWLRPRASPPGWRTVVTTSGAVLPYPPGWRRLAGDLGTATAALRGAHHGFLGYLNLTPRQGAETLTNWRFFRVDHNAREGDRNVKVVVASQGLRFHNGHGACVRDDYTTTTGAKFIELACLVKGPSTTSVIVGAAPPQAWARISPFIERAISAFTT
jgi:hypothetical protein